VSLHISSDLIRDRPAHNIGSDKNVDLGGSRYQLNNDRKGEPEIGKRKPRKDEVEEIVLVVSYRIPNAGLKDDLAYESLDMEEEHPLDQLCVSPE
jgi:hypothetical protein